jgi:hypothetical protein
MGPYSGEAENPGRCIISPVTGIDKPLILPIFVIFLNQSALPKAIGNANIKTQELF